MEVKCRACLSTKDTKKYYPLSILLPQYFKTNLTILELLEVVTSTSICSLTGAPDRICQTCLKQLKDCYTFIDEFKKAQLWLKRKCTQLSVTSPVKVEKHDDDSDLGDRIIIRLDKDRKTLNFVNIKKDPSVEDDKQDLNDSESLLSTNQSGNDAEISVIKHDDENIVYIEHNYPSRNETLDDPNSSPIVMPETIIIKVDPVETIPNKILNEPVSKIKPKTKKNVSDRSSPKVSYKFKEPPAVVCEICKSIFYTERALCVHKEIVHRIKAQPDPVAQKDKTNKSQPSEESKRRSTEKDSEKCKSPATRGSTRVKKAPAKRRTALARAVKNVDQAFTCDICQEVCNSTIGLNRHRKNVHQLGKLKASVIKIWVCSECGLQCRNHSAYSNHKLKHKGKQFGCDECTKVYYTTTQLKDHKRLVHGVGLTHKFLCTQCGKRFKHLNGFKYHLASVHHGEKPYMCKFCGYKSFTRSYITYHERSHTGEKPYECILCHKKFRSSHTLKEHQFTHKGISQCNCEYCGKGFIKPWNMKLHWLNHPGKFGCKMCSKSFVDERVLKFHYSRSHKEEKEKKEDDYMDISTHLDSESELILVKEVPVEYDDSPFDY